MQAVTVWQTVSLLGGPLDGDVRAVDASRDMFTDEYVVCVRKRLYGGELRDVPQLDVVSYRRISESVFEHCRTQSALGDTHDLGLPDQHNQKEEGE